MTSIMTRQYYVVSISVNILMGSRYIKLLDFVDFAVQSTNSGIGPFASRVLNLTQSIHIKVKTCNGKSVDIYQTIFSLKTPKKLT